MIRLKQITGMLDILGVLKECGIALFDQKMNDATILEQLARKFFLHGVVIGAYLENKPAGFISYYRNDAVNKVAFVSMFAVMPKERCLGVGSLLIGAMEDDCCKCGLKVIRLEVAAANHNAIAFYRKKGYREESRKDKILLMVKAIGS